jgi:DNA-binding MarR family transcriptional regulator
MSNRVAAKATHIADANQVGYEITLLVRDHCLCLHVQRAARALARRFDEAFRLLDLTNGQFSLMMALNRPEPPTLGSVAALLAMDRTTLTAALKPLERRGFVKIAVDQEDRRNRRLSLTAPARALLTKALPIWMSTHNQLDKEIAPHSASQLRVTLRALS